MTKLLKKRIHIIHKTPPVAFTELEIQPIIRPWEIECRRRDGSQLRISSTGPLPDLTGLVRDFLA